MNAVEKLEAAIKRLLQVKSSLGFVMVGEDPTDLYVRVEEDDDGDGNTFAYGLSVGGGVDSDEEINDALALVAGTIDAQLAILRFGIQRLKAVATITGKHAEAHAHELALATAILGD